MGNSLQDQLLKAGLINEQKLKQSRSSKHKTTKKTGRRPSPEEQAARQAAQRAQAEKIARDRELNRQRQEEITLRAAENEIRQLIHRHRVIRDGGDIAFNFSDGGALKRIYVNKDQQAKLVSGQLAIVRQDAFYELIAAEVVERVRERDPSLVLVFNQTPEEQHGDDPYADYQVPDDLMW